jgi:hypothetical protein
MWLPKYRSLFFDFITVVSLLLTSRVFITYTSLPVCHSQPSFHSTLNVVERALLNKPKLLFHISPATTNLKGVGYHIIMQHFRGDYFHISFMFLHCGVTTSLVLQNPSPREVHLLEEEHWSEIGRWWGGVFSCWVSAHVFKCYEVCIFTGIQTLFPFLQSVENCQKESYTLIRVVVGLVRRVISDSGYEKNSVITKAIKIDFHRRCLVHL